MSIPTTSLPDSRNGITSSGRGSPGFRTAELATEPLHRIPALFQPPPDHTTERPERLRPTARLGALRHLPRDDCRPQRPLPRIVRGRDRRIVQKPHQVATLVVPSQFVEQPLIVRVHQGPRPQVMYTGRLQLPTPAVVLRQVDRPRLELVPQAHSLLQPHLPP